MKKILGQTPTRASRTLLTIALSAMLVACGGGGGPAEGNPPPRFESITVGSTAGVRDNQTGIVWAAQLGSEGLPNGYLEPTAAELLQLTDVGAAALRPYFGFVLDAASPLIKAKEAVNGLVDPVRPQTWAVDFGTRWRDDLGSLTNEATGAVPDFHNWYVLSRQSEAAGVFYPPVSERGTVTAAGLSWKFCTEGRTWVKEIRGCTGPVTLEDVSFAEAEQMANNATFDGQTDWRLPTPQELRSLLQLGNNVGSGNLLPSSFAGDPGAGARSLMYWTSRRSTDGTYAWVVDFSGQPEPGGIELAPVAEQAYVRLVRTSR